MLRLDPSILPDPFKPAADDAYGLAPSMSQLVVLKAYETNAGEHHVHFVVRGDFKICDCSLFAPMLVSLGFIPTGRMTSEPLPVGPRIKPSETFHAHVEPGSFHEGVLVGRREALDPVDGGLMEPEHRALARRFGPMLRLQRAAMAAQAAQDATHATASPPVDNVAIETGRDVLAAALAKAVWLAQDSRHEAAMPPFMRIQVQAGLVADAVRVLGLIDGKDPHHDGEALQQALAILRQVAP